MQTSYLQLSVCSCYLGRRSTARYPDMNRPAVRCMPHNNTDPCPRRVGNIELLEPMEHSKHSYIADTGRCRNMHTPWSRVLSESRTRAS